MMKNMDFLKIKCGDVISNLFNLSHLIFEVTDACNLHCKYCGYADLYKGYDKRENLRFPFTRAKRVTDYLYELWKKNCVEDAVSPNKKRR